MSVPQRVTIELTNRCSRRCPGCPRHHMTYPIGDMRYSLFLKIIRQLPSETVIVPFFRGESTLHPRFDHVMDMLQVHQFHDVQLATNGDYLNAKNKDAISHGCSFFSLSLHEFRLQHPHQAWMHELKTHQIITQVSIVDSFLPDECKQEFVESWLQWVDRVRIYTEHSHNGFGSTHQDVTDDGRPCHKPFEDLVIYWDGKVALCNHDWDTAYPLGDLHTQTVKDIWNGWNYHQVRQLHLNHGRRRVSSCESCDYYLTNHEHIFGELYQHG